MFAIIRNVVAALIITIIAATYAAGAETVLDFGHGTNMTIERIDQEDLPSWHGNWAVTLEIVDKESHEGFFAHNALDVSSCSLPKSFYFHNFSVITHHGKVQVYGYIFTEDVLRIYEWLKSTREGQRGELAFVFQDGDYISIPTKMTGTKTSQEELAKLLLCVK